MASAALPRPPNCSPEPLLEAASWVLAGAGAAGREGGSGREGEVDGGDQPVGGLPAAA